jgi:hypothetical protein
VLRHSVRYRSPLPSPPDQSDTSPASVVPDVATRNGPAGPRERFAIAGMSLVIQRSNGRVRAPGFDLRRRPLAGILLGTSVAWLWSGHRVHLVHVPSLDRETESARHRRST